MINRSSMGSQARGGATDVVGAKSGASRIDLNRPSEGPLVVPWSQEEKKKDRFRQGSVKKVWSVPSAPWLAPCTTLPFRPRIVRSGSTLG